jgi:hypothetical protein
MAKQKAEETYPKHTPVDSNIGSSSDEVFSTPLPVPDDACPYKYPKKVGDKFAIAPVKVNRPCAVPPTFVGTVDNRVLIVGPNQHSATKYSIVNHTIAP